MPSFMLFPKSEVFLHDLTPLLQQGKERFKDVDINPDLTVDRRREVEICLQEFTDVFTNRLGCTSTYMIEHDVHLPLKEPVRF